MWNVWWNICLRWLIWKIKRETIKISSIIKTKKIERIKGEGFKISRVGKEKGWALGNLKIEKSSIEIVNA